MKLYCYSQPFLAEPPFRVFELTVENLFENCTALPDQRKTNKYKNASARILRYERCMPLRLIGVFILAFLHSL